MDSKNDQELENILEDADNLGVEEQNALENQILNEHDGIDAQQGDLTVRHNAHQQDVNIY